MSFEFISKSKINTIRQALRVSAISERVKRTVILTMYVPFDLLLFFSPDFRREKRKAKRYSNSVPRSWTVCLWPISIQSTTACRTKRSGSRSGPCASNKRHVRSSVFYCVQKLIKLLCFIFIDDNYYYFIFFYVRLLFLLL